MANCIAIIGLGYVGLPLAVAFGKKNQTIGFDIDQARIKQLKKGKDNTKELSSKEIARAKKLQFTHNKKALSNANVFIITVPTPIDKNKKPNLKFLLLASKMVGENLKKGDVVIYESTVYPGCTEEDCVPVLEKTSGLIFNKDFACGYSPERINPGDKKRPITKIKKITSGSNSKTAKMVDALYKSIIKAGTHKAESIKIAEAAKVIENCQRDVNISLINELAVIFEKMDIDTTSVLRAAGTKWNFLPFKPGLVGGHCISVDPYYLAYKAEELGHNPQVILSGRRINNEMGVFIASKVIKLLINKGNKIKGSKALVLGLTFKENCPDIRNTKVIDVCSELSQYGINVDVFDPVANKQEVKKELKIKLLNKITKKYNAIILAVAHKEFLKLDYKKMILKEGVIYDVKSILNTKIIDARL